MIKEKKYINEPAARVLIDPRDEDIVIVSSKGRTSIWIDGNEVKDVASVAEYRDAILPELMSGKLEV